jgi:lincosamide nucleotidyltransferase B/F
VFEQLRLISRVERLCRLDNRLDAALMYGSFAQGKGDLHSDVEFWLFFTPDLSHVEPWTWCNEIAPVLHLVRNEFGAHVALFAGLIRGEFHFATVDDIAAVGGWPARSAPIDRMIVVDRHNRLRPILNSLPAQAQVPETWNDIEVLCGRFANWLVLAHHVRGRGELLRALDALAQVHRHLLWMARLVENNTEHWLTPSRQAEAELHPLTIQTLVRSTAAAQDTAIRAAILEAWSCGRTWWTRLANRYGQPVPQDLFTELDHVLAGRG